MPIQFEDAYVNPNIKIKGSEIPLEQLQQTSDTLQKRYDTSYENLTKFQELAKQTEQIAHPEERQKVKDYVAKFQPEIDEMIKNNELHNVGWKTMSMANNAANNLKQFEARASEIKSIKDKIASTNINDVATRQYYQDMLNKTVSATTYNPENNTFNFQPINAPNIVQDYDYSKFLFDASGGWKADSVGNSFDNLVVLKDNQVDAQGNIIRPAGVYNKKDMSKVSEVKYKEVKDNILKALKGSPGAMEALDRDVKVQMNTLGIDPNDKQAEEKIFNDIYNKKVLGVAEAAAKKEAHIQKEEAHSMDLADANTQLAFGFGTKDKPFTPFKDEYESTLNPGEKSPLVSQLAERNKIGFTSAKLFNSKQGVGDDGKPGHTLITPKSPEVARQLKYLFSGLSVPDLKRLKEGNPQQQALYNELNQANVYNVFNKVIKNEPIQESRYRKVMSILDKYNYTPSTAYKFMSINDSRLQNELFARNNNIRKSDGSIDPIAGKHSLNESLFGKSEGLVIDKNGKYNKGVSEGLTIFDPATGEAKSMNEFLEKNSSDLKDQVIQVSGKIVAGSLPHANSDDPQQDLSYLNAGHTVDINGKQYIVGNKTLLNTPASNLGDLASFGRYGRTEKVYKTDHGDASLRSDYSGNVYITYKGKTKKYLQEEYNNIMQQLGESEQDPVKYLPILAQPVKSK
jgi:hypothetical protein